MGGSGRAKRAMPTLAAKSAARMGHPDLWCYWREIADWRMVAWFGSNFGG